MLVAGAAAGVVLGTGETALAQRPPQPPRVKGPLVWLDMDQQDLDDGHDQPRYTSSAARWRRRNSTARAGILSPR
jgi:hypothetical protein